MGKNGYQYVNMVGRRRNDGKGVFQVPDTGTQVLDKTRSLLCSSIASLWIRLAHSKEHKCQIFRQYWYTRNAPVFTNTGTFQYLGPEVYFFQKDIVEYDLNAKGGEMGTPVKNLELRFWLREGFKTQPLVDRRFCLVLSGSSRFLLS